MKAYFTRRYKFSASHRLHCDTMSAEENRATYGKCNNPHGHGHNYIVAVTVTGQIDPQTGMVCNLADLDAYVNQNIVSRYELQNLNTLPEFQKVVPTSENLCIEIYDRIQAGFRAAALDQVRLEETTNNFFAYAGGRPPRD